MGGRPATYGSWGGRTTPRTHRGGLPGQFGGGRGHPRFSSATPWIFRGWPTTYCGGRPPYSFQTN
jgi:hypothetical protein